MNSFAGSIDNGARDEIVIGRVAIGLAAIFCRHGRRTGNAYTALTSGVPSGEFAKRMKENPKDVIAGQGGLPIKSAEEVIGAVGMSGVPNGADKEEACAQAAIDRVVHQLK